jgi:7,8-dihydropterin-6-yl-methyl-4-(beta-D-ribofuranosyl)aminobenzene 5'-phosphate synthase
MNITILSENSVYPKAAKKCQAEWGLSLFIEVNGKKILFDTGASSLFRKNAENLKIDLEELDYVVLSHFHWDHSRGLQYLSFDEKIKLITHPDVPDKVEGIIKILMEARFNLVTQSEPVEFTKDVFFLGEIPRVTQFEKGRYKKDKMLDDTAIAIKTKKGAIVITGCSHSGICNICQQAKKVTAQPIYAVIGGFHLAEDSPKVVQATIDYFKSEQVQSLFPMHCVDFPTLSKFYNEFKFDKLGAGALLEL